MTILVTGAYGGIGKALCRMLAELGLDLAILGRDSDKLLLLTDELRHSYGVNVFHYALDLTCESDRLAMQKALFSQIKTLSGFIHCAGILSEKSLMMTKVEDIQNDIQINLISAIELSQFASKLMIRKKTGVISLLTSVVAEQGSAGQAIYGASKAGIIGFVKSLAKELGPLGIRVNAVSPGFIETNLVAHYDEARKKEITQRTALIKLGKAEDVANLLSFLHSDKASYITGQVISVDGGLSL